jgi:hypothetical protein
LDVAGGWRTHYRFRNEQRYFDYRRFESESQLLAEP